MALAMFLGALVVVAFDVIRMSLRAEVDPDVGLSLLMCLPRWVLGLPLVFAAWGALGDALQRRFERKRGAGAGQRAVELWLAAPLLACVPALFSGAAIRESAWRWPGLCGVLVFVWLGVAGVRRALDALAARRTSLARVLSPLGLLLVPWLAAELSQRLYKGLYPAFHELLALGALLGAGLFARLGLSLGSTPARRGPGATWLTVFACAAWTLGGQLARDAGAGRLALIEGAPLLGALVAPAHALDTALEAVGDPPLPAHAARRADHARLAPSGDARRHVLLITVDALRADALEPTSVVGRCMPRLNALAARSVSHTRAYAPSNETVLSLVGLLSGRTALPREGRFTRAEWLAEAFGRAGWSSYGWFTGHDMPPVRLDLERARAEGFGFQGYQKAYRPAREVLQWAAQRLHAGPAFVWLHLSDVHGPFHLPAPAPVPLPGCDDPYLQRHAALDVELSTALASITAQSPDLVWVVSADHGESRGERGSFGHGSHLFDEQVRVPLLLGGPGLRAGRVREVRSLYDLGAVLMDAASVDVARSALRWPFTTDRGALLVTRAQCGLVADGHKLIANPGAGTLALYALDRDPAERDNLLARDPGTARRMLQAMRQEGCPLAGLAGLSPR